MRETIDELYLRAFKLGEAYASEASKGASTRSSAFQEGADTAILHQAPINPYRRALRALTDPETGIVLGGMARLEQFAQEWEDGYVSNYK